MVIGLGRRKESSAKVKLIPGKGELIVNDSISKPYNQQNLFMKRSSYLMSNNTGLCLNDSELKDAISVCDDSEQEKGQYLH